MGLCLILLLCAISWIGGKLLDRLFETVAARLAKKEDIHSSALTTGQSNVIILPITWRVSDAPQYDVSVNSNAKEEKANIKVLPASQNQKQGRL
ncbi:MAG: hypothetical protein HY986_19425 [Candidatus Melainabacteria bacterium]|nr:hypothetical protein [Candidatus Melainabacteria bacterium]